MVKTCYEVSDYAPSHGFFGSGKIISVVTTVNESGANPCTILGLVSEWFGDSVVSSINTDEGDASPTDETYCSFCMAEETSHFVTEDPVTDTTNGKG